jgi:hypothetical protein
LAFDTIGIKVRAIKIHHQTEHFYFVIRIGLLKDIVGDINDKIENKVMIKEQI